MRLLLDTHVFLWYIKNNRRLSKAIQGKISDATEVYISSASVWEIAIKSQLKKMDADIDQIVDAISESGFSELPITVHHAAIVSRLAGVHRDPFDRMLIAQAMYEPLTFLTADAELSKYSELVEVIE
jgi:PIN domain nuclease of toxin-antitoxin system